MADRRELVAIITADPKGLDAALANAGRRGRRGATKLGKELAISVKRGFGSLGDLIGLGGVAGILAAGKNVFDFQKRLVRLRQASSASAGAIQGLERSIFKIAQARGLDPDELLAGAEKYTELTGDLQGYIDSMDQLGMVSAATGSNLDEISEIAAAAGTSMGVASKDMNRMFDVLVRQGKAGSVELKNMGRELPSLIAMHRNFGKTGVDAMAELGALMQMGKKGFGTASETATGYMALMGAITQKAQKLKKFKVNVFDAKGNKRAASDILKDLTNSKLGSGGKNEAKLMKLLGSKEAVLFFNAFKAEGEKVFQDLADQSKATGTIAEGYKIWDDSPAKKMASAQAKMAEFFNTNMAGHIEKIAVALDKVAEALQFVVDNWQVFAALALGSKAGGLLGLVGGAGGLLGPAGGGGAKGLVGKGGLVAAAGAAGYLAGDWINEKTGASSKIADTLAGWTGRGDSFENRNATPLDEKMRDWANSMAGGQLGRTGSPLIKMLLGGDAAGAKAAAAASDAALAGAMQQSGVGADVFTEDQLMRLRASTDAKLLAAAPAAGGVDQAAAAIQADLVRELRALRQQMAGGGTSITVQTDDGNRTSHRRRGM